MDTLTPDIQKITRQIIDLSDAAASLPALSGEAFSQWRKTAALIEKQIPEERLRVAVVGSIKSGKSTFINALLGNDHLRRGAGVVTSIVTRITSGPELSARLDFKSPDEINTEMKRALTLFPDAETRFPHGFDIRDDRMRASLAEGLSGLSGDRLVTEDSRNVNQVVLSSFVNGFERMREFIAKDLPFARYGGDDFCLHRDFVGDETLAVYLKDVRLTIPSEMLSDRMEIADCQGSDSPNPLHLALIQDYLLLTHLTIYVVSSRMGLRRADMRFLSLLRRMGILENTVFVVNADLSEHDGLDDVKRLSDRVRDDLRAFLPEPTVFTFSALYHLFESLNDTLPERDLARLDHWRADTTVTEDSRRQFSSFTEFLFRRLTGHRRTLLVANHLQRLAVIADGMYQQVRMGREMLSLKAGGQSEAADRIHRERERMGKLRDTVRHAFDGAAARLKTRLRPDYDRFFDTKNGELSSVFNFTASWELPEPERFRQSLETDGLSPTMYRVFLQFKQDVDRFMAEQLHPAVAGFIRELEGRIAADLADVSGPFDQMVKDALADYASALSDFDIRLTGATGAPPAPDLSAIRREAGIQLPSATAVVNYSTTIRTEAILRLGYHSVLHIFRRVMKKAGRGEGDEKMNALKDGIKRMKRETERSMRFHFNDYRENIKYQYVFKLVDAAAEDLFEALADRFRGFVEDLSDVNEQLKLLETDRRGASAVLDKMESALSDILARTGEIREQCGDGDSANGDCAVI